MAAAFARRLAPKGTVIISGGTRPASRVNPLVVEVMREVGMDLSGERPRATSAEELADADYVITMGCSANEVCPATFSGDVRDWALPEPKGRPLEEIRRIRDEIEARVQDFMSEIGHRRDL